jgi:hypothetical protein
VIRAAKDYVPKDPVGVGGSSPIAFGGGMVLGNDAAGRKELREQDPVQLVGEEQPEKELAAA